MVPRNASINPVSSSDLDDRKDIFKLKGSHRLLLIPDLFVMNIGLAGFMAAWQQTNFRCDFESYFTM